MVNSGPSDWETSIKLTHQSNISQVHQLSPDTHTVIARYIYAARHAGIEESGTLKIAISSVPHGACRNLEWHGRGERLSAMVISFNRENQQGQGVLGGDKGRAYSNST